MRNVMRWLAACAALAGLCTVQAQEYPTARYACSCRTRQAALPIS